MMRSDVCDPFAELAAYARTQMVDMLRREGAITDPTVEAAFRTIPRHLFLDAFYVREQTTPVRWKRIESSTLDPHTWCHMIYADDPRVTRLNEIGNPISSSSAPTIMAHMLEVAHLASGQRVLEIGTGSGYNAALLSFLVGDPTQVVTIELAEDLARAAQEHLVHVVGPGVRVIAGDGFLGYPPGAPYERIIATASTHRIPLAWLDQVCEGGSIVMHVQGHLTGGCLMHFQKHAPGRSGYGQMIAGADFMELRTPATPPVLAPRWLPRVLREEVTSTVRFSADQFDPTLLWNHDLAFLLQMVFPTLHLMSMSKQAGSPPQICMLDERTDTLLVFALVGGQQWTLDIRGNQHVWERVSTLYQQWVTLGRPVATSYTLHVDADGKQQLVLTPASVGGGTFVWAMDELT